MSVMDAIVKHHPRRAAACLRSVMPGHAGTRIVAMKLTAEAVEPIPPTKIASDPVVVLWPREKAFGRHGA